MTKIKYYFDEMMPHDVVEGLEQRGIEVVMAVLIGMRQKDDLTEHLPYATENGFVLVTYDHPFAGKAAMRTDHAGLICWNGKLTDMGVWLKSLLNLLRKMTQKMLRDGYSG